MCCHYSNKCLKKHVPWLDKDSGKVPALNFNLKLRNWVKSLIPLRDETMQRRIGWRLQLASTAPKRLHLDLNGYIFFTSWRIHSNLRFVLIDSLFFNFNLVLIHIDSTLVFPLIFLNFCPGLRAESSAVLLLRPPAVVRGVGVGRPFDWRPRTSFIQHPDRIYTDIYYDILWYIYRYTNHIRSHQILNSRPFTYSIHLPWC